VSWPILALIYVAAAGRCCHKDKNPLGVLRTFSGFGLGLLPYVEGDLVQRHVINNTLHNIAPSRHPWQRGDVDSNWKVE
jgi:hypothetical protein